ncbi:hypothetical protein Tco_1113667 [Tanacetum coccineum]|uniref:Retrovirus-related Pol polyprotein from transposon TNT 1-94-like beta-barrel domain-containing protein n=1 Tax=Tanacetum coccineum TaxID=301880 RepID=A0ABQ5IWJ4_9ASTR
MRHFARECRVPRSKEGQFRNQDNTRKQGNNEDTYSKAILAIGGVGFDWSDMAEEQVQTNMYLMVFSESEVYTDKTSATYKRGLATVEEQLITYRKNEVLFSEEVAVLKREISCKDYEINVLKSLKRPRQVVRSQITDKSKKGLGYSAVPPPHPLIYNRPNKLDLSYSGLDEFKEPEFKGTVNTAHPKSTVLIAKPMSCFPKIAQSTVRRPFQSKITLSNKRFTHKVNTAKAQAVNTARPQAVNTASPKTIKTARPNSAVGKPQQDDTGFVDSGCSRHMTGNIAYLSDFKEFDGGYVTFGGGAHGGGIKGIGMGRSSVQIPSKGKDVNTVKAQAVNTARPQAVNTDRPKIVKTARPNSAVVNAVRVN